MLNSRLRTFFSKAVPSDSRLRRHMKWVYEDARSLLRAKTPWEHLEDEPPIALSLETTNICNANCIFCAYQYQKEFRKGKGVMSDEIYERALDGFKRLGGKDLSFTPLVGEPLVDQGIVPRVARALDEGFDVGFHTNGILLNKVDVEALLKTGLRSMCISTAPLDEASHSLLYRTHHYTDLLKGIEKLLMVRNDVDAPLRVTFHFRAHVPMKRVLGFPDFHDLVEPLLKPEERASIGALITGYDTWGGHISQDDLTGIMELAIPPKIKRRPCLLTFMPQVLWDGKVRACPCFFGKNEDWDEDNGLYVGDLNDTPLDEIWRGARVKGLRRRFVNQDLPDLCKQCATYRSC